jgi:hypothetical protein
MTQPPLSQRIERSPVAQVLISIVIVVVLLMEVATHLPAGSAVHQSVSRPAQQIIRVVAAEQAWGVFAPNPRSSSLDIEARVTFADGTTALWELPEGSNLGPNLRYYRWRKWLERARSDDQKGLWAPTARWIATLYDDRESPVVRVELIRRFHKNVLVGPQPPWESFTYFTLELDEAGT